MLSLNFNPFPNLATPRLFLRQVTTADEHEIFFLRSNESVNLYVDRPKPVSLQDARNHIERVNNAIAKNESIYWGITLLNDPALIGTIGLWNISKEDHTAEVGFELKPAFQGKGIMAEAFSEIISYGFNILKASKLVGWVHRDNSKSIALLSKCKFTRDINEEAKVNKTELADMAIYTLNIDSYAPANDPEK